MYNLIKMELYRLCHATSTWVILLVTAAITVGLMVLTGAIVFTGTDAEDGVTGLVLVDSEEENASGNDSPENGVEIGFYVNEDDGWNSEEVEFSAILASMLQSGLLALLCLILAATYVYADQKNGYVKNIAGQYASREKLVFAKCVSLAAAVMVLLGTFVVIGAVATKIIWGSRAYLDSFAELMKIIGVHYLLLLGLSLAILLITVFARSSTAGVIVGILVSSNMLTMLCQGINLLVQKILPNANFDCSLYTLTYYLGSYGTGATSGDTARAVALAVLYGTLAAIAAAWTMRKRDVV